MKISIIVAQGKNGQIGNNNHLLWKIKDDMLNFKYLTSGHHVLMGRLTFESIGKPLPNRVNMIITKNTNFQGQEGCIIFDCSHKAIDFAKSNGETELFVCGGSTIYDFFIKNDLVDRIYLTNVDYDGEADKFFPNLDHNKWKIVKKTPFEKNKQNEYGGEMVVLDKLVI
jgi:dihydrofolate reductase